MIRAWVGVYLKKVDEGRIVPAEVDHLLCHYSAKSLRAEIVSLLENTAGMIPGREMGLGAAGEGAISVRRRSG
ncbi:MAG: hypothetical protein WDM79_15620 [Terricaulis sp.]